MKDETIAHYIGCLASFVVGIIFMALFACGCWNLHWYEGAWIGMIFCAIVTMVSFSCLGFFFCRLGCADKSSCK